MYSGPTNFSRLRLLTNLIIIVLFILVIYIFTKESIGERVAQSKNITPTSQNLRNGDLIFRKGKGFFSSFFSEAGNYKSPYSHVGIAQIERGRVFVIHTEASELTGKGSAKSEPLDTFLGNDNAYYGAAYRYKQLSAESVKKILETANSYVKMQIPFDLDFDLSTEDRLYCTELVWSAYKTAGIDIAEKDMIKIPVIGIRKVITPGSILHDDKMEFVTTLK